MWDIHHTIDHISKRMAGYLRFGTETPGAQYVARNITKLAPANLTPEQDAKFWAYAEHAAQFMVNTFEEN